MRLFFIFTLLFSVGVLSGCGQKGPLYLPEQEASVQELSAQEDVPEQTSVKPGVSQNPEQQPSHLQPSPEL